MRPQLQFLNLPQIDAAIQHQKAAEMQNALAPYVMQKYQQDAERGTLEMQVLREQMERQKQIRDAVTAQYTQPEQAEQAPAASDPRSKQASMLRKQAEIYSRFGDVDTANKLHEQALKLEPEFGQTPQYDQQGNAFVLDKQGNPKYLEGVKARDEVVSDDMGGQRVYRTKYSATPISSANKTVTPDAILTDRRVRSEGDKNRQVQREANGIQQQLVLQEKQLKVGELQDKADERKRAKDASIASIGNQIAVIDKAIDHPGRETATGLSGAIDPRNYVPGTDARDFQVVLDQIGGTAFLQAFESLKGGGQITEVEGRKATDAIARLNRAQSDAEFASALGDLRDVMTTGYKRLSGADYVQPASKAGSSKPKTGQREDGYMFLGGDPADPSRWKKVGK